MQEQQKRKMGSSFWVFIVLGILSWVLQRTLNGMGAIVAAILMVIFFIIAIVIYLRSHPKDTRTDEERHKDKEIL